jgi:hypothetical protein
VRRQTTTAGAGNWHSATPERAFSCHGLKFAAISLVKGVYPLLWGIFPVRTGQFADRIGAKS